MGYMEMNNVPAAVVTVSEPGSLISRYAAQIVGQLGCFDRIVITGSLLGVSHRCGGELFNLFYCTLCVWRNFPTEKRRLVNAENAGFRSDIRQP